MPIKYIAWVDWAFMGISFLLGTGSTRIAVAAAVVNYFLFFGKDILFKSRVRGGSVVRKAKYQQYVKGKDYMHKCTVCGITEKMTHRWTLDTVPLVKGIMSTAWNILKIMNT